MALDPRMILMAGQTGSPLREIASGFQAGQDIRANMLAQQAAMQEMRAAQYEQSQLELGNKLKSMGHVADVLQPYLNDYDFDGMTKAIANLRQANVIDDNDVEIFDQDLTTGNMQDISQRIAMMKTLSSAASEGELIKGSHRFVNRDGQLYSEVDIQEGNNLRTVSNPVEGQIARKATGQTALEEASLEVDTADKKRRVQLYADFDIKPNIQRAIETAVQEVKRDFAIAEEQRGDDKAFDVYRTGVDKLITSLGATSTGPFWGLMPAMSANQQMADGALAAMEPLLKGVFVSAGEGTFTDDDAKRLRAMLPDRYTAPEARAGQIAVVDAIVRSKLGQPVNVFSSELGRQVSMGDVYQEAVDKNMSVHDVMKELGIKP